MNNAVEVLVSADLLDAKDGSTPKFPQELLKEIKSVLNFGYRIAGVKTIKLYFSKENLEEAEDYCFLSFFKLEKEKQEILKSSRYERKNFVFNTLRKFRALLKRRELAHKKYKNSLGIEICDTSLESACCDNIIIPFRNNDDLDEKKELLDIALKGLKDNQKAIIWDYFYSGHSIKTIALKNNKSCQAIHKYIWSVVGILRKKINQMIQLKDFKISKTQTVEVLLAR
jgi:hypothetical protein